MGEKRFSFRVATELDVTCHLIEPAGDLGSSFPARTVDVSATGVKLAVDIPVKLTRRICVQLRSYEPFLDLLLIGRLVRAEKGAPATCALRFEALTGEAKKELTKFVFAQAKRLEEGLAASSRAGLTRGPRSAPRPVADADAWLTADEFAAAIGQPVGTALDLLRSGGIPGAKQDWLVPAAAVGAYAAGKPSDAPAADAPADAAADAASADAPAKPRGHSGGGSARRPAPPAQVSGGFYTRGGARRDSAA